MKASKAKMNTETLRKYAYALHLPPEIFFPVIRHFVLCLERNGSEWTCNRFKSVKLDFIRLKAGLPAQSPWVARENNKFKGPFGGLQSWCSHSYKRWSKAIQLLQIYSTLYASEVTPSQAKKFVDAVCSHNDSQHFDKYNNLLLEAVHDWFPKQSWYPDPDSLLSYPVSNTRREPDAEGKSHPEGEKTLYCAQTFLDNTAFGIGLVRDFPDLFGNVLRDVGYNFEETRYLCKNTKFLKYNFTAGKIGLIQEPGMKLRAVANPARVFQCALKPLGDQLYRKLQTLPWDCTHEQDRPFVVLQRHLENKQNCHAVDLSNATDFFPLSFQLSMLNKLFIRKDAIQLFELLSRSEWYCDLTETKRIKWTTGQPLGLYPSFASFAMCHGFILYGLNGKKHDDKFFVLGDDVVILDDILFGKYMSFLNDMGIPFSPSKTISSNYLTEFGGKIITQHGVMNQLKWRHVSDDSFLDLASLFGDRFKVLMRPRQRAVYECVKFIPTFMGGCGLNPDGIPLDLRIYMALTMMSESHDQFLLSYNRRLQQCNYCQGSPSLGPRWYFTSNPRGDVDQTSAQLAREILPFNVKRIINYSHEQINSAWQSMGSLLYWLSPSKTVLPIAGTSKRFSRLEVLESQLKKLL